MASGTTQYRQADVGNLGKFIGDKIGSARKMAAEARQSNKDSGVETGRGYFFGKALASQFGGDLINRTKGTFSQDPSVTQDPALSKEQRFKGGIQNELNSVKDILDDGGTQEKPLRSWLTPLLDTIAINNKKIADGLRDIGNQNRESTGTEKEQSQAAKENLGFFSFLTDYLKKDNALEAQELALQKERMERAKAALEDAQSDRIERMLEAPGIKGISGEDDAGATARKKIGEGGGKSDGILANLVEGITEGLAEGFAEKFLDRFGKDRKPKKFLDRLNPFKRDGGKKDYYSSAVDSSRNSARNINKTKGWKGKLLNMGSRLMFAEGTAPESRIAPGLVTRPTTGSLGRDDAVVPLSSNNPIADLFDDVNRARNKGGSTVNREREAKLLQDTTLAVPQVAAGITLGSLGSLVPGLGAAPEVSEYLIKFAEEKSKQFGLPPNIITNVAKTQQIQSGTKSTTAARSSSNTVTEKKEDKRNWFQKLFGLQPSSSSNSRSRTNRRGRRTNTPRSVARSRGEGVLQFMSVNGGYKTPGRPNHKGIDLGRGPYKHGEPVVSLQNGRVVEVGNDSGGWGNYVVMKHNTGKYTLYGHLDEVMVKEGDPVGRMNGELTVIGTIGNTGRSTGSHLHFEIGTGWDGKITGGVDPTPFINDYVDLADEQVSPDISSTGASTLTLDQIKAANDAVMASVVGTPLQQVVERAAEQQVAVVQPLNLSSRDNRTANAARQRKYQGDAAALRLRDLSRSDSGTDELYPVSR